MEYKNDWGTYKKGEEFTCEYINSKGELNVTQRESETVLTRVTLS